jgi:long-chain acyl-CoA synthetase
MTPDSAPGGSDRPWLRFYDDDVPAEVEVPDSPFTELLDHAAERWPGSAAICFRSGETSYRELRHDVELLSTCLARLGVGRGDRVAFVLPNCPQLVVGLHAVLRLGGVAVPLNPTWSPECLTAALADSGAEVVLCLDRLFEVVGGARDDPRTAIREIVVTLAADYLPALDRLTLSGPSRTALRERALASGSVPPGAGVRMWNEELRRARGRPVSAPRKVDGVSDADPAVLIYPGSGAPDPEHLCGSLLTSRNVRAAGLQAAAWLPHARPGREVVLVGIALCTAEGIALCLGAATLLGAALLLVPGGSGDPTPTAMDGARPTVLAASPGFLTDLEADAGNSGIDLRSVRVCITGPEPLAARAAARYEELTGSRLVDGLSVTGAVNVLGTPVRTGRLSARRHGIPMPSTEVRVLDPEGEPLPAGLPGRLAVRGPQVFAGFWRHPEQTAMVLSDGWLRTDLEVCLHEEGWVEVLDRRHPAD